MLWCPQESAQDGQAERRMSSSLASTSAGGLAPGMYSAAGPEAGALPPRAPEHQSRSKRLATKMLKKLGTKDRFRNPHPEQPGSGGALQESLLFPSLHSPMHSSPSILKAQMPLTSKDILAKTLQQRHFFGMIVFRQSLVSSSCDPAVQQVTCSGMLSAQSGYFSRCGQHTDQTRTLSPCMLGSAYR